MGAFADGVNRFVVKVERVDKDIFVGCTVEAQRAITVGSEITNSPGQPVRTGALRDSYIPEFIDDHTWESTTNLPYARGIENGVGPHGPLTLRSAVGGFHSIGLLVAGWRRVVSHVAADVRGLR